MLKPLLQTSCTNPWTVLPSHLGPLSRDDLKNVVSPVPTTVGLNALIPSTGSSPCFGPGATSQNHPCPRALLSS